MRRAAAQLDRKAGRGSLGGDEKELGVKPMAYFVGGAMGGVDPKIMGVGPVAAVKNVMKRTGLPPCR